MTYFKSLKQGTSFLLHIHMQDKLTDFRRFQFVLMKRPNRPTTDYLQTIVHNTTTTVTITTITTAIIALMSYTVQWLKSLYIPACQLMVTFHAVYQHKIQAEKSRNDD